MLLRAFVVLGCILSTMILVANDATFIALYDSEKYDEAAKALQNADLKNHEVARRAGAMYYRGLGVEQNKERGKAYIEAAMSAGDAKAAINLAKIWYRAEHNPEKAAWCLLVAENAKDESIQADVAKLHERFGSDYKTGLEQYIRQQDAAMKDAVSSLKKDHDREKASFHQQLLESDQTQKELRDQIRALEEKSLLLQSKLEKSEDKAKTTRKDLEALEEKYRLAEKQTCDLIGTTNEQKNVIRALEGPLEQTRTKLISVENELSSATNRLSELAKEHGELEREHAELQKEHGELQNEHRELQGEQGELQREHGELQREHTDLQSKHRELLIAYKRLTGKGNSGGDSSSLEGIGRGFATLVMAPCNYFRVVPQTSEMADEIESKNGYSQLSVILAFPLLVWDTIPVAADVADGVLDIVSLGSYGDWLYGDGKNSPWWFERDNNVFPWIQKAGGK